MANYFDTENEFEDFDLDYADDMELSDDLFGDDLLEDDETSIARYALFNAENDNIASMEAR